MRKLLSILLILLLPVQGMLGHAMAMQMELAKAVDATVLVAARGQAVDVLAAFDCEVMAQTPTQDEAQDTASDLSANGGCSLCADCPLCHLLAATSAWPVAAAVRVWATPLFTLLPLLGVPPLPIFKPPIFQV